MLDATLLDPLGSEILSIAFVDAAIAPPELQGLQVDRVVFLNNQSDGIGQVDQVLSRYKDLESIHILSHGSIGVMQLGNTFLDQASLSENHNRLSRWGDALTKDGDLLFYGCSIAADSDGITFVEQISQLTQADVAASDDLTGNDALGGDWQLEVTTGEIEAASLSIQDYQGLLPIYNNHEYVLTDGVKSWQDAQAEAESIGGNLVTINDADEEVWLKQTFGTAEGFWIGINDRQVEGQFEWVSGEAVTYNNWAPGEPNNGSGNQNYGWMNFRASKQWDDHYPTAQLSGIIEIDTNTSRPIYNNHEYVLTDGVKSWQDAQAEAESIGGNLVTINDADEEVWLKHTFGTAEGFWIGINDRQVEGQFEWVSGETSTYTNWAPGEPNNGRGNQDYGWMNYGASKQWDDHYPTAQLSGIIEIDANTSNTFALQNNTTIFVNEAVGVATVTAVRTGATQGRATLEYTTNEISGSEAAQADDDYTTPTFEGRLNTGQIVFESGEAENSFTIPIIDDALIEEDETFAIGLQNPSSGTLGSPRTVLITILDDDAPSTLSVSDTAVSVSEGETTATITIQRSGDVSGASSVNFNTNNGTASADSDYTATSGTLYFVAGQTTQVISIPILDDALTESSETFSVTLSNPTGATLGSQTTTNITILDNDFDLGNLTRNTVVSGLDQPTTLDWTPDGRYMFVAQKNGVVRVIDNGTLQSTPLVDLSSQVNNTSDRGLLGLAIHPEFPNTPFVYLLYTYDPPETSEKTGLAGPDGGGNRPSRLVRLTVDPTTMTADPNSLTVLVGKNSNWEYTSRPDGNSTGDVSILPSGIVNDTTINAPADQIDVGTQDNDPNRPGIQNQNIRDYLATDSLSHSIGDLEFGPDGLLYLSNGDGTSYNFADPRAVRIQDINNLSGKVLRIDPITGQGVSSNPFFNGDGSSNQSKVFYYGLRNPYRFTFDPVTQLPIIGDVGWNSQEEINTGVTGSNFGWPYLEGANQTGSYQDLSQAISFYENGNRNNAGDPAAVFPILSRSHGAPDNATAITVGDFYDSNTLMFGDVRNGTLYAATFNDSREVTDIQIFDSDIPYVVDMKIGPDEQLYGVDLVSGTLLRWEPSIAGLA
ncbi:MAG: DUF4347 domain-containing protein [Thermosynechococcaceae cyanobacterium]